MYIPPFTITSEIMRLVSEISEQVGIVTTLLGDNVPSPMLRKANRIKTIHSSLAIEHNTLSLKQVTAIIDGKHVLGAPNEIQEVKNALQAYHLMSELDAFKEKDLLKAHELMMMALIDKSGQYRQAGVGVFDGDKCIHMAPPADRVPQLMHDLFEWAHEAQERGAGEILFTSMNHDGVKQGYANSALARLADTLSIPVIASGGAGSKEHFRDAFLLGHADAALAASVFHFGEIPIPELKKYLQSEGINVRL